MWSPKSRMIQPLISPGPFPLLLRTPAILSFWFPKNPSVMQETQEMRVWSLDSEDPLEKDMATHSSAWKIPWTEGPGRLQSKGFQRVRHYWATKHTHTHTHTQCHPYRSALHKLFLRPKMYHTFWCSHSPQAGGRQHFSCFKSSFPWPSCLMGWTWF